MTWERSGQPRAWCILVVGLGVFLGACGPGPQMDGEPGWPEGSFSMDFAPFLQDRPAVAHRWYDYDASAHVLSPKDEAYVVRVAGEPEPTFAALGITSYYDEETAESGVFSLWASRFEEDAWSEPTSLTLAQNVKDGPTCVDLFAPAELGCDEESWQVQLRADKVLVPEAALVVQNPAVHFRSRADVDEAVLAAVVPAVSEPAGLPAPIQLSVLDDGPANSWESLEWDNRKLAPDLPEKGMLFGERAFGEGFTATGDLLYVVTSDFRLLKLAFTPSAAGELVAGVDLTWAVAALDQQELIAAPFGEAKTAFLTAPAEGERVYLAVQDIGPTVAESAESRWLPPPSEDWAFALERVGDELRILLSPSAIAANGTALGGAGAAEFEEALPPGAEELD